MPPPSPGAIAELVLIGSHDFRRRFGEITGRAWRRFDRREWEDGEEDARERILLYDVVVAETLLHLRRRLDGGPLDGAAAGAAREAYRDCARGRADAEVAETFFNSVIPTGSGAWRTPSSSSTSSSPVTASATTYPEERRL